jgi:hypothetical protein
VPQVLPCWTHFPPLDLPTSPGARQLFYPGQPGRDVYLLQLHGPCLEARPASSPRNARTGAYPAHPMPATEKTPAAPGQGRRSPWKRGPEEPCGPSRRWLPALHACNGRRGHAVRSRRTGCASPQRAQTLARTCGGDNRGSGGGT